MAATAGRGRGGAAGRAAPLRWTQLLVGLLCWGMAIALMIRSGLGLGPWDALHMGLHLQTGISVGVAVIGVGVAILAGTLLMGVRPGVGTVANMVLVGVFLDLLLPLVPAAAHWGAGLAYYAVGIALGGVGTGMYIGVGMGSGPRDGLMLALSQRSGWPVRRVRTLIEAAALGLGWGLGGAIGVGTVIYTLAIGPAVQWSLQAFGAVPPPRPTAATPELGMEA